MLAAAIVCATVMAQAAQTNWQATGMKDYLGTALKTSSQGAFTITCAFYTGDTLVYTDTGSVNTFGAATGSFTQAEGALGSTAYNVVLTVVDKDGNTFTASGAYTSGSANTTINFNGGTGMTSTTFSQSGKDYGWAVVPEPTSAMLMLLGMAGLALRRRRA